MKAIVGRPFRLAWDLISIRFGARQRFAYLAPDKQLR